MVSKTQLICTMAILETLKEVEGAPESMLWLPCQGQGMDLMSFQAMIRDLESIGAVKRTSPNYYAAGEKIDALLNGLNAIVARAKAAVKA